jgi:predicted DNA-binding transcriptional regulator AlpA
MTNDTRCYLIPDVIAKLQMSERTFRRLLRAKKLPFLEELHPRLGRIVRYRADLVDRYLEGRWNAPRSFASARRRVG